MPPPHFCLKVVCKKGGSISGAYGSSNELDHTFWQHLHSGKAGRGGASSGVITSLAEALRHEVFTQTQRANSLQFSW